MNASMASATAKYRRLVAAVEVHESAIVAYSGGVDSTLVAAVASRVLGDRCLVVTGISASLSADERRKAADTAQRLGFKYHTVETHKLNK